MKIPSYHYKISLAASAVLVILALAFFSAGPASAETTDFTLGNGLRVIIIENHRAPVASMLVWVKAGSAAERPGEYGLAHVLEHMLFKGTARRGPGEIAREIEAHGGDINAYTSYDQTVYYLSMASRFAERGLDVLGDMVFNPSFDPTEFTREKEVVLEEVRKHEDDPRRELSEALFHEAYPNHPYGRPIIGYEDTISGFTRDDAVRFHQRWYRPDNMILVAAGDLDSNKIRPVIEKIFGRPASAETAVWMPPARNDSGGPRAEIMRKDVETARLTLAFPIPEYDSQDTIALDVLGSILGSGRTSRLYQSLRQEKELVHGISAGTYNPKGPGLFLITADLDSDKVEEAVRAVMAEIADLIKNGVQSDELDRTRLNTQAAFVYSRSTMSGEARVAASFEVMEGDWRGAAEYLADLDKVTPGEIQKAAAKYLNPDRLTAAVLLPQNADPNLDQATLLAAAQPPAPEPKTAATSQAEDGRTKVYTLSNGARLLVRPDHSLPLTSIRAAFMGGLRYEIPPLIGVSSFMAEVWDRGTQRQGAEELAREVEDMAADISSFSGRNSFGLEGEFLTRFLDPGLALFTEVLTKPRFDPEEVDKARPGLQAALKRKQEQLTARAFRLFAEAMYKGHPYSHDQIGTPASVDAITSKDIRTFYEKWARPSNLVLAVVGDVNPDEVRDKLENLLGNWRGSPLQSPLVPPIIQDPRPWPGLKKVHDVVDRNQSHLILGFPAPGLTSADRPALELLDALLSGMGGRLFVRLRDEQSLAYSVSSFYSQGLGPGAFGLYIAFDPAKYDDALSGFHQIIDELRTDPVPEAELQAAKEYLLGGYEIGLQTYSAQAAELAFNELYGLGPDFQEKWVKEINAVTSRDILETAQKYLSDKQYVRILVGPDKM